MKVLVTGGSGFIGQSLKKIKPDWIYISSKDYDLTDPYHVRGAIRDHRHLDAIVHLAGKVGGIKDNATKQAEYMYQNLMINTNIIHESYKENVPRVLSALSTCVFPNQVENYPFDENDLHKGAPAVSNLSYGYAKRCLHVMSEAYKKQYNVDYSTFSPSNVYGPGDDFNLETSHFVSALVRKVADAKEGDTISFWGNGKPLRQQLYVEDLVTIIPLLLEKHHSSMPIIVSPPENLSIKKMIEMCLNIANKDLNIKFNKKLDGQFRKDGNNKKLLDLIGDFKFTPFEEGLRKTYEWYQQRNK